MWSLLSSYAQPEYARRIGVLLPPWRNLWSSDGIAAENGDMIVDRFTDGTTANPFFCLAERPLLESTRYFRSRFRTRKQYARYLCSVESLHAALEG